MAKKKTGQKVLEASWSFVWGDKMSSTFFRRNIFTVIILIGMIMVYISFKYECQTQAETIDKLNKELAIQKSESIRQRSEYKSGTRESTMQERIDSMHLNLHVQEQPPFVLERLTL